jgi:hypothetical protein
MLDELITCELCGPEQAAVRCTHESVVRILASPSRPVSALRAAGNLIRRLVWLLRPYTDTRLGRAPAWAWPDAPGCHGADRQTCPTVQAPLTRGSDDDVGCIDVPVVRMIMPMPKSLVALRLAPTDFSSN